MKTKQEIEQLAKNKTFKEYNVINSNFEYGYVKGYTDCQNQDNWISVETPPAIGDGFNLLSDDVLAIMTDGSYKVCYYDHNINDWIVMSGKVFKWQPLPPLTKQIGGSNE